MRPLFARADIPRESLYIGLFGLLLFTLGFWNQPFVEFEARFALFAQEMWRHGISLFPTAYGEPYPDYPATSTLLIYITSLAFGAVTKLSAILPTAIAAALNLMITYRLFARFSRPWAALTVGFEILTVMFLAEARSISLDQMVATITLGSFYIAYTSCQDRRFASLWWLPVLLVLGFAIRGPLGVVLPAGVVCSYYALSTQWRRLLGFGVIAAAVLLACWGGQLFAAGQIYGNAFVRDIVHMQVAGRLEAGDDPRHLYYFTSSFGNYALAYPLAILVGLVVLATRRQFLSVQRSREDLLLYLIGWVLIVIAGLSIPETKKARYLLPIVPAIAALAAYPLLGEVQAGRRRVLHWLAVAVEKLFLILPLLAAIALRVAMHRLHKQTPPVHLSLALIFSLLLIYQLYAFFVHWRWRAQSRTLGLMFGAVLTVWTLNLLIVEPIARQVHDSRNFVEKVEAVRKLQPGDIVFFQVGKDAAAIKYLANLDYDLRPQFLADPARLDAIKGPAYLILEDKDLPELTRSARMGHLQPVVHERFDHHFYSVFYLP